MSENVRGSEIFPVSVSGKTTSHGIVGEFAETHHPTSREIPPVYFYSNHPLVARIIKQALLSDPGLRGAVKPMPRSVGSLQSYGYQPVMVLDTCSVNNWPDFLVKWFSAGYRAVVLLSPELANRAEQVSVLYLGVSGIVTFSANLEEELPQAVHSVVRGRLWISRDTFHEYVKQTNSLLHRSSRGSHDLTAREEQIHNFLIQDFSNKQIGAILGISERTVKFHVSRILQKKQVKNRQALIGIVARAASF
jgi:DNA-binding CsgD family transcriptional regulator